MKMERKIDLSVKSENMPVEITSTPLFVVEDKKTVTFSEEIVESTTTSVGFYRGWQAHFYWLEFGTVS